MLHSSRRFLAASLLLLATTAACNEVEPGMNGLVEFVPDDCGQAFCDLDDGLAVDATTEVYLNGRDGRSVDGLTIRTSRPSIAEIVDEDLSTMSPRVTVIGNATGEVDLLAVDQFGYVVDWTTIHVAAPDELRVDVWGDVDGPHAAAEVDDLYFVSAGTAIELDVGAMADGAPLMGKLGYGVVLDWELAQAVEPGDDVGDGHFRIDAPAGEHTLIIATSSAERRVHLSVK